MSEKPATVVASETYTVASESCREQAHEDLGVEDPEQERAAAAIRDNTLRETGDGK